MIVSFVSVTIDGIGKFSALINLEKPAAGLANA